MIAPRLWNQFKKHSRVNYDQTASARLRNIIEEDLQNDRPRVRNTRPDT